MTPLVSPTTMLRPAAAAALPVPAAVASVWPRTRLIGAAVTLALAVGLALPALLSWPDGIAVGAGLGPLVLGVLSVRVSRWYCLARVPSRAGSRFMAIIVPTGVGVGVVALGHTALGHAPSMLGLVAALPVTAAALGAALAGRELETRVLGGARRVFLVGDPLQHADLATEIATGRGDLVLAGCFDPSEPDADVSQLVEQVEASGATTLILSDEAIRDEAIVAVVARLHLAGTRVRELRGFYEQAFGKVAVSELTPSWFLFDIAEIHRPRAYGLIKRAIEIVVSAAILVATLPVLPVVALAIKLASPAGPVFFRQVRVGKAGRHFHVTKFRTMHPAAGREHGVWATQSEDRLFRLGELLRKFRIDELPQLWHILRGDMSLVGPRPEQPAIVERLQRSMQFYSARHAVRPGLTGWAQVSFGYGGSDEAALTKLQYDLYYVKRQSVRLDLLIIAATVRTILGGVGR